MVQLIYALLAVVIVVVACAAIIATTDAIKNRSGVKHDELVVVKEQRSIGEKTLRSIANGSGNPVLEAQIALDEITRLYDTKELH